MCGTEISPRDVSAGMSCPPPEGETEAQGGHSTADTGDKAGSGQGDRMDGVGNSLALGEVSLPVERGGTG